MKEQVKQFIAALEAAGMARQEIVLKAYELALQLHLERAESYDSRANCMRKAAELVRVVLSPQARAEGRGQ